ncbi:hypoxanthine-guanine phosphoribosyltransferase [Spiroplasma corruscae]|uniref:Hypoxanthine-guanine phosphoribosyltransferase n=1 Tax=Spiroplasma corruscae TaxID=216934 RepID=A0A222ENR2_9MOLU|nr:phosphoribosyltransferase family protein [Spiroplasma corruscae]ASP28071.1 hypoxanthine-guanine phosphoribosyltransferase [Spiroplasma corruscae]
MIDNNKFELLISKEEIHKKISEYADKLNKKYSGKTLTVIAILNGAIFFFTDLLKKLNFPIKMDTITVSSYDGIKSTDDLNYHKKLVKPIVENEDVLIIEDIIDTGKTMNSVYEYIKSLNPKSLELVVLASKSDTKNKFNYDYESLFVVPDKYIVGYGFAIDDLYRQLEDIYIMKD